MRPRVACFGPLPPDPSGISDYSEELLPYLAEHLILDLYASGSETPKAIRHAHRVIDCSAVDPLPLLREYDAVLYHMGNSPSHLHVYQALRRWPGLVVLHDFSLHHMVVQDTVARDRMDRYFRALRDEHGPGSVEEARRGAYGSDPFLWETGATRYPLNRSVLENATAVLVHSHFIGERVQLARPELPVRHVDHHAYPVPTSLRREAPRGRHAGCTFVSAGHLTKLKHIGLLLRTLASLRDRVSFHLDLVGEPSPELRLQELTHELGLDANLTLHGRVGKLELYRRLLAADVCVALRHPTMGETSGIVMRALACGCALVVSDVGWFGELPDDIAVKIPIGDGEADALAHTLEALARDPDRRRRMSDAALLYAQNRDPASRARAYRDFVLEFGTFPRRRVGRVFFDALGRLRELGVEGPSKAALDAATQFADLIDTRPLIGDVELRPMPQPPPEEPAPTGSD